MVNLYSRCLLWQKEKLQFLGTALLGKSEVLCGSPRLYPARLSPGTSWHQLWGGLEPGDLASASFPNWNHHTCSSARLILLNWKSYCEQTGPRGSVSMWFRAVSWADWLAGRGTGRGRGPHLHFLHSALQFFRGFVLKVPLQVLLFSLSHPLLHLGQVLFQVRGFFLIIRQLTLLNSNLERKSRCAQYIDFNTLTAKFYPLIFKDTAINFQFYAFMFK